MPITVPMGGVGDEMEVLPAGAYNATAYEWEQRFGRDSGQPYISLTFQIASGDYSGRKLWSNYSLQPQSLWALKRFLITAGITEDSFPDEDGAELDIEPLLRQVMGRPVVITATVGQYQGRDTNNVEEVSPAGTEVAATAAAPW